MVDERTDRPLTQAVLTADGGVRVPTQAVLTADGGVRLSVAGGSDTRRRYGQGDESEMAGKK